MEYPSSDDDYLYEGGDDKSRQADGPGFEGANDDQADWNEFSNVNDKIEQNDFSSVFEFLKAIRYKQKKQKRFENFKQGIKDDP